MEKKYLGLPPKITNVIIIFLLSVALVSFSIIWRFVFAFDIPLAPTNLTQDTNSNSTIAQSISLRWTDNATNEDKFVIEKKLSSAMAWVSLAQIIGTNITSYTDTAVYPGTSYDYRVQACLSGTGCSDYATITGLVITSSYVPPNTTVPASTSTAPSIPLIPSNLVQGTVTDHSVTINWTDNSNNEDKFNIDRKLSTATAWTPLTLITTANTTSYTDTTVTPGSSYNYRVQACLSGTGCSDYTYLTTAVLVPFPKPLAPTEFVVNGTPTYTYVPLKWVYNSSGTAIYKLVIEKKLSTATAWMVLTQITSPNITTHTDTAVTSGVSYDYRISVCTTQATCSDYKYLLGVVIPSNNMSTLGSTTTPITNNPTTTPTIVNPPTNTNYIPNPPTGLSRDTYSSLPYVITIKWIDNATNEDKFSIERKLSSATDWSPYAQILHANALYYVDTVVSPGSSYDYRVQACLSGTGCSGYAEFFGVRVPSLPVPKPVENTAPVIAPKIIIPVNTASSTIVQESIKPVATTTPKVITEQSVVPIATTTEFSAKVQDLGLIIDQRRTLIDETKQQLSKIINDSVSEILSKASATGREIDTNKINGLRDNLLLKIDTSFTGLVTVTPADINNLKIEVGKGIDNIRAIALASLGNATTQTLVSNTQAVSNTFNQLSETISTQSEVLKTQEAALLYKDTNKDGISDYDSVHVYNIDPVKTSPVSNYEGKVVNASEKIILGFDPTKKELVKVKTEEPTASLAPVVSTYKVKEVKLSEKKEVVIKGESLPNSFVTIYIYSTPIMVTVKADENGEWQYTMDKEIENGNHTIYTATVNNAGNIIAKSPEFLFTKTADAATLKDASALVVSPVVKPALLQGNTLIVFLGAVLIIFGAMMILMGINYKKKNEEMNPSL